MSSGDPVTVVCAFNLVDSIVDSTAKIYKVSYFVTSEGTSHVHRHDNVTTPPRQEEAHRLQLPCSVTKLATSQLE